MKENKVLAGLLCSIVMLSSAIPSFANTTGPAVVTTAGGTGSADAILTQEATTFSVSVPTVLPVWVDSAGVVTTATDAQIINNSFGPVTVEAAALEPANDWNLVDFETEMTSMKVGSKQFGFELQNAVVPTTGICDVSGFVTIDGNGGTEVIDYNSIVAPQKSAVTEEMANLVFTIGWKLQVQNYEFSSLSELYKGISTDYVLKRNGQVKLDAIAVYSTEQGTWKSSDENILTVSGEGLVSAISPGIATITYTCEDVSETISFEVAKPLEQYTWTEISAIADSGLARGYFNIGDRKTITLNGKVAAATYNNQAIDVLIIGFDHNAKLENAENTISFMFANALTDSYYFTAGNTAGYRMNLSQRNSGGWNNSYMNKTILPTLKSVMNSDLTSVIQPITKYTDNTGNKVNTAACVTATTEDLFLLSGYETNDINYLICNKIEANYQSRYEYFYDINNRLGYTLNNEKVFLWTRSPRCDNNVGFYIIYTEVPSPGNHATLSYGIRPGFNV